MTTTESVTIILSALAIGAPSVLAWLSSRKNGSSLVEIHFMLNRRLDQFFALQEQMVRDSAGANQAIGAADALARAAAQNMVASQAARTP